MDLGTQIRLAREKKKLTPKELGDAVGVSKMSVSYWEANETTPRREKLALLEEVLGVSLSTTGSKGKVIGLSDEVIAIATEISRLAKGDLEAIRTLARSLARNKLAPPMGGMSPPKATAAKKRA